MKNSTAPTTAVNALASLSIKDAKSYGNNSGAQFTTRAGVTVLCLYTKLNQSITCSGVAKAKASKRA